MVTGLLRNGSGTFSLEKFPEVHSTLKEEIHPEDGPHEHIERSDVDMLQVLGYTLPPDKQINNNKL